MMGRYSKGGRPKSRLEILRRDEHVAQLVASTGATAREAHQSLEMDGAQPLVTILTRPCARPRSLVPLAGGRLRANEKMVF